MNTAPKPAIGGQVAIVYTKALSGGLPMQEVYMVAEPDPDAAEKVIEDAVSHDEVVKIVASLTATALTLKPSKGPLAATWTMRSS